MHALINLLSRFGLLKEDVDYHLLRASMVVIFLFFGYQKWFDYEALAQRIRFQIPHPARVDLQLLAMGVKQPTSTKRSAR